MSFLSAALDPLRRSPAIFEIIRLFHPGPRLAKHLHFRGDFIVPVSPEAKFKIRHYGYRVENELFWHGYDGGFEGVSLRLWRELAMNSTTILDIGANTGIYALAAAAVNPAAKVVALEPVPRVFDRLKTNADLNGGVIACIQAAASDADGSCSLFDTEGDNPYSASLDPTMLTHLPTHEVEVRTVKLDTLVAELSWPKLDLVKIDVEKHEPSVFSGMAHIISTSRPTILVEVLNQEIMQKLLSAVAAAEYRVFQIPDAGGASNYLFIASERDVATTCPTMRLLKPITSADNVVNADA